MEYVHVKKLKEYNPKYEDRNFVWFRFYIKMVQGDPDFEMITSEIDKWRYCTLIGLELQAQKPLPLSEEYFIRKGWNLAERKMSLTFEALRTFVEVRNGDLENPVTQSSKEEVVEVDKNKTREEYNAFEEIIRQTWNLFSEKYPTLSKIKEITGTRRKHLKERFEINSFKDFNKILLAIEQQPFLIHGSQNSGKHDNWKVSFDWLIANDTNYIKVLEMKYVQTGGGNGFAKSGSPKGFNRGDNTAGTGDSSKYDKFE